MEDRNADEGFYTEIASKNDKIHEKRFTRRKVKRKDIEYAVRYIGPVSGIDNHFGISCWLSCIVQILYHLPLFRERIYQNIVKYEDLVVDNKGSSTDKMKTWENELLFYLQMALILLEKRRIGEMLEPVPAMEYLLKATSHVMKDKTILENQQDLDELFSKIIDVVGDVFSRLSKGISPVDMFYGTQRIISNIPIPGDEVRIESDPISTRFNFHISPNGTLYEAMETCLDEEMSNKRRTLDNLADCIVFTLKRYTDKGEKNHNRFEFPQEIFLDRFLYDNIDRFDAELNKDVTSKSFESPEWKKCPYDLLSIVIHDGEDPQRGHYYMYRRLLPHAGNEWICHDDKMIRRVKWNEVQMNSFGRDERLIDKDINNNASAYLLVYVKRSAQSIIFYYADQLRENCAKCPENTLELYKAITDLEERRIEEEETYKRQLEVPKRERSVSGDEYRIAYALQMDQDERDHVMHKKMIESDYNDDEGMGSSIGSSEESDRDTVSDEPIVSTMDRITVSPKGETITVPITKEDITVSTKEMVTVPSAALVASMRELALKASEEARKRDKKKKKKDRKRSNEYDNEDNGKRMRMMNEGIDKKKELNDYNDIKKIQKDKTRRTSIKDDLQIKIFPKIIDSIETEEMNPCNDGAIPILGMNREYIIPNKRHEEMERIVREGKFPLSVTVTQHKKWLNGDDICNHELCMMKNGIDEFEEIPMYCSQKSIIRSKDENKMVKIHNTHTKYIDVPSILVDFSDPEDDEIILRDEYSIPNLSGIKEILIDNEVMSSQELHKMMSYLGKTIDMDSCDFTTVSVTAHETTIYSETLMKSIMDWNENECVKMNSISLSLLLDDELRKSHLYSKIQGGDCNDDDSFDIIIHSLISCLSIINDSFSTPEHSLRSLIHLCGRYKGLNGQSLARLVLTSLTYHHKLLKVSQMCSHILDRRNDCSESYKEANNYVNDLMKMFFYRYDMILLINYNLMSFESFIFQRCRSESDILMYLKQDDLSFEEAEERLNLFGMKALRLAFAYKTFFVNIRSTRNGIDPCCISRIELAAIVTYSFLICYRCFFHILHSKKSTLSHRSNLLEKQKVNLMSHFVAFIRGYNDDDITRPVVKDVLRCIIRLSQKISFTYSNSNDRGKRCAVRMSRDFLEMRENMQIFPTDRMVNCELINVKNWRSEAENFISNKNDWNSMIEPLLNIFKNPSNMKDMCDYINDYVIQSLLK